MRKQHKVHQFTQQNPQCQHHVPLEVGKGKIQNKEDEFEIYLGSN